MNESAIRERMALHGKSLFDRGYGCGSSGNISVKMDDGILISPTNSCMGRLDPAEISKIDWKGNLMSGAAPSKEAFLHLKMYEQRPNERCVVHLHSTYSVAVSCLANINKENVLPPITAYYVMRVGTLPLIPYYAPGDSALAEAVGKLATKNKAMLLANHGPIISGKDLDSTVYSAEELEETAKLFLLLKGHETSFLNNIQIADLYKRFPN
jgi:ribulose-5-phosphate 4-epimerase/fuculose-1-phosphate aldolase